MDVERFRKKYLSTEDRKEQRDQDNSYLREKYLAWVRAEDTKSRIAAKKVSKLKPSDLADIERENSVHRLEEREEEGFEMKITESGETFVFDSDRGYQQLNVKHSSPDFIEIDPQLKTKFKFFQCGDTVYDRDGYFLYRLPGLS